MRRRAAWWEAHKGQERSFIFEVQPGVRLELHLDSELCRLIYCRDFEYAERAFLNGYLRPGDVFVDVGANIGLHSMIAAHRVGSGGRIVAFEPISATFARLRRNAQLNAFDNLILQQVAVTDQAGELHIHTSRDGFDAWNSAAKPTMGSRYETATVPAVTLDEALGRTGLAEPQMIKIDVEGWEGRVIAGARRTLNADPGPVLQVEFAEGSVTAAGTSCRELHRTLRAMGYELYTFDPQKSALNFLPELETYPFLNVVAAKDVRAVSERLL